MLSKEEEYKLVREYLKKHKYLRTLASLEGTKFRTKLSFKIIKAPKRKSSSIEPVMRRCRIKEPQVINKIHVEDIEELKELASNYEGFYKRRDFNAPFRPDAKNTLSFKPSIKTNR